jgi:hypothetical protein
LTIYEQEMREHWRMDENIPRRVRTAVSPVHARLIINSRNWFPGPVDCGKQGKFISINYHVGAKNVRLFIDNNK